MNRGHLQTLSWRDIVEIVEMSNDVFDDEVYAGRNPNETYPTTEAYYRAVLRRLRKANNMPPPVDERFPQILKAAETVVGCKLTDTRSMPNTMIRSFVAYRMHKEGYSHHEAGVYLERDHATMTYLYYKVADMFSVPDAYKEEIEMLERFESLCSETSC